MSKHENGNEKLCGEYVAVCVSVNFKLNAAKETNILAIISVFIRLNRNLAKSKPLRTFLSDAQNVALKLI